MHLKWLAWYECEKFLKAGAVMESDKLSQDDGRLRDDVLLELRGVSKSYVQPRGFLRQAGSLTAVDAVSFAIESGMSLGLVGESGCGKSTLGRIACGLLRPDRGEVLFHNKKLPPAGAGSWASGKIQMIFQDPASCLDPRSRVGESLAEPLRAKGVGNKESLAKAEEILEILGLPGTGRKYPHEFSGGQKQRIAIGRAIATDPDFIVCDEPVSALDASVQAQILNLLKEIQERYRPAYLFISHDLAVVGFMCAQILVMYLGQIVERGKRESIFANPAHPYTVALMQSMPGGGSLWRRGKDLEKLPDALPGDVSSPWNPAGCRFYPRCGKAQAICSNSPPPWQAIAPGWKARCHFPNLPR